MKIYTVHQAKSQLSKLIRQALNGEEIIIARGRHPMVRLTTLIQPKRTLGFLGDGVVMAKSFNRALKDFDAYQ